MSDENATGKSRKQLPVLLGILGAVLGFIGAVALAPFNRMDPITSGWTAILFFGPIGAVIGAFAGAKLATLRRATAGTTTSNALKALGIAFGTVAVVVGGYALYEYSIATPWLRPGNVALQFEVKLPAGTAMPPASGVKAELQTPLNTMPADMEPNLFRLDGDRPVIVGQVWLHYRTNRRQIEVKIPGQMDRTYQIKITDKAPHQAALGAWQPQPDGSEIRYRSKWPGQS
jgi:hypothetical protein